MKKQLYSLIAVVLLLGVTGCEKDYDTDDLSSITYYPEFTMAGSSLVLLQTGETYIDPGVSAEENGVELEVGKSVSGTYTGYSGATVPTDVVDEYVITYSATNSDGYAGTVTRTVIVASNGDLVNSIEGLYTSTAAREPAFDILPQYTNMKYIFITKISDNEYTISDAVGGYYFIGRGYGYDYAAQGAVITANDISANDFSFTQAVFPLWGNTVEISDFVVDAGNKSISFTGTGNFGNGAFKVTLNQVEL